MPFDALLAPPRSRLLSELLDGHGVEPVPLPTLATHKRVQLERFAPSFWHQHQTWLPLGLMGSVGCMAASGGIANGMMPGSIVPSWLTLFWFGVMSLLIVFGVFRVNGAAHWEERYITPGELAWHGVPESIAAVARALHREAPESALVLGELKREELVLDPYLLLVCDQERLCLGIWDGPQIIAVAGTALMENAQMQQVVPGCENEQPSQ